jgi:hypothetical protein
LIHKEFIYGAKWESGKSLRAPVHFTQIKIKGFRMDTIWGRGTIGDDTTKLSHICLD